MIFCNDSDQTNVEARKAVHIGDDEKYDKDGANAVGIHCWSVKLLSSGSYILLPDIWFLVFCYQVS